MPGYDELHLRFQRSGEGAYAVAAESPAGDGQGLFEPPFSDEALENFVLKLSLRKAGVLGFDTVQVDRVKRFGAVLFAALFRGEIGDLYRASRARADRAGRALRIILHLAEAPALAGVPWEYLFDDPDFPALSRWTPVIRKLEVPNFRRPARIKPPLRVLGMVSSPPDHEPLSRHDEQAGLEGALGEVRDMGLVEIEWCESATLAGLHDRLEEGHFHVFHYVGHGSYDLAADDGVLFLERPDGSQPVSAMQLGTMLREDRDLRLAVLSACQGARMSRDDPFAGVAGGLVRRSMPAVVAMQFDITMTAARVFTHHFYKSLARGHPVDTAVAKGRQGVYASGNELEWGTPVLFLQVRDGRLFDIRWREGRDARLRDALERASDALPEDGGRVPVAAGRFALSVEAISEGVELIAVRGEVDLYTAMELRAAAMASSAPCLVIDLSEVTFLDSTALGVFTSAEKRQRGRGGELRLVVPEENASLRLTFEITGHDEVHAIYPSRSAALEAGR